FERIKSEHVNIIETAQKDLDAAHQESAKLHKLQRSPQIELGIKLFNIVEWSEAHQCIELESELQQTAEEHETPITSLTAELTFANENISISHLESNIKERNASYSISLPPTSHIHRRNLQTQERDLHTQLEVAIREKAESDIILGMSKERVGSLMDNVAKLRRTVYEMQQTSAVRDETIVQLRKEQERDRVMLKLNITLDSEQQELELIKRNILLKCIVVSNASKDGKSDTPFRIFSASREPQRSHPSR
ncbi:hypothetical protein BDR03DRAFT_988482, partial [Suillus americanus]